MIISLISFHILERAHLQWVQQQANNELILANTVYLTCAML